MTSTLVWLASDDPEADPRQVAKMLVEAWKQVAPDVAERVAGALGGSEVDRSVYVELDRTAFEASGRMQPDGALRPVPPIGGFDVDRPICVELDGAAFGVSGRVRLDVLARRAVELSDDPEQPPRIVGTRIEVALHPVPTIDGPDLSQVVTLTALARALGAQPVEREGWLWALAIPGTNWVIGRPRQPEVCYGLGQVEEPEPRTVAKRNAWRKRELARLAAADVVAVQLAALMRSKQERSSEVRDA